MIYTIRDHMKQILFGVAVILAVALGAYIARAFAADGADDQDAPIERLDVAISASASGWEQDSSTPAIVRVKGATEGGEQVDYYHAFAAVGIEELELEPGAYELDFISPVNSDGQFYDAPSPVSLETATSDRGKVDVAAKFTGVAIKDATDSQTNKLIADITEAVSFADDTLAGAHGQEVLSTAKLYLATAAANPARAGKQDAAELGWADGSGKVKEVVGADQQQQGQQGQAGAAGQDGVAGSDDAQAAAEQGQDSPSSSQAAQGGSDVVRKWVDAVYSEKSRYKAVWVDDGDGTGHYELREDGMVKRIEQPGHYEA